MQNAKSFCLNVLKGLVISFIALELVAGLFLIILINFKSYRDFNTLKKAQHLSHLNWFEERYDFHPFLNYAQKRIDDKVRLFQNLPSDQKVLRLAIQGGSFAMYFSDYLTDGPFPEKVNEGLSKIIKDSPYEKVEIINMAAGGYRQPQQLISSGLWLDKADIFLSIEGFNEYAEHVHQCLPPEWSRSGIRFHPLFNDSTFAKLSTFFRKTYIFFYHWSNSFDPLGKVGHFFLHQPLLKLYYASEVSFFENIEKSDYCRNLLPTIKAYYAKQRDQRNKHWESFIRRHHALHEKDKNLITIFQPNHHFTNSKILSQFEKDLLKGRHFDFIDQFYPQGQALFKELKKDGLAAYDFSMIFKNNEDTFYRDYCCHLNDEGHQAFLEALIPLLKNKVAVMNKSTSQTLIKR